MRLDRVRQSHGSQAVVSDFRSGHYEENAFFMRRPNAAATACSTLLTPVRIPRCWVNGEPAVEMERVASGEGCICCGSDAAAGLAEGDPEAAEKRAKLDLIAAGGVLHRRIALEKH